MVDARVTMLEAKVAKAKAAVEALLAKYSAPVCAEKK